MLFFEKNGYKIEQIVTFNNKTFNNVFFNLKNQLVSRLELFKNIDRVNKLGLPHTLGLVFYGKPGTGKMSVVKAIANETNRNIMRVKYIHEINGNQHGELIYVVTQLPTGPFTLPENSIVIFYLNDLDSFSFEMFEKCKKPGCIDLIIPFSNCTKLMFYQMYNLFYNTTCDLDFTSNEITPKQLYHLFFECIDNKELFTRKLNELNQTTIQEPETPFEQDIIFETEIDKTRRNSDSFELIEP